LVTKENMQRNKVAVLHCNDRSHTSALKLLLVWEMTAKLSRKNEMFVSIRKMNKSKRSFIVCPCNMINIFIITNIMHTIGVDKIALFKTT